MSEDELSHWWGINLKYSEHPPVRNDFPDIAVSIGSGLSHFRDIITVAEEEQQSVGLDVPLVCPMSCMYHFFFFYSVLFHFYLPIVTLRLRGFPAHTTSDTLLKLLRLFGSVYSVRVQGNSALCTMSSETGNKKLFEIPFSIQCSYGTPCSYCEWCSISLFFLTHMFVNQNIAGVSILHSLHTLCLVFPCQKSILVILLLYGYL